MDRFVAIDFGMTRSVMAYLDQEGQPKTISDTLESGAHSFFPSVLLLEPSGKVLFGKEAVLAHKADPEKLLWSIKQLFFQKKEAVTGKKSLSFLESLRRKQSEVLSELKKQGSETEWLARFFQCFRKFAAPVISTNPCTVILTIPYDYSLSQRSLFQKALEQAGFEACLLIEESRAVLAQYLSSHPRREGTIAVFDAGSGKFSLDLFQIHKGEIKHLVHRYEEALSGNVFDEKIAKKILEDYAEQTGLAVPDEPAFIFQVIEECEKAKRAVSHRGSFDLKIPTKSSRPFTRALSRFEVSSLTQDLVEQMKIIVREALKEARLSASDVDELLVVGGLARMPFVKEAAESLFQKKAFELSNNNHSVVFGAILEMQQRLEKDKDVC